MFVPPLWLLLAFLTGLSSNVHNFINRYILKDGDDATAYAWYFELGNTIFFLLFAFADWHIVITPYSLLLFFLLGLTEFIAVYWYMKMHSYSELSISSIISRTRMIWIPILALFFINEHLRVIDYIGILIVFLGVSLTSAPKRLFIDKGAMYANLSAFMIAANIIITSMLLPFGSDAVINVARGIPAIFLFPLLMKNPMPRIKKVFRTKQQYRIPAVILSGAAIIFFTAALRVGDASKINAVYQGMMIFSVLAGIIFLKERGNIGRKIFGAVITIIGVVVLSLS